jgi:hypothetical protein
VAFFGDPTFRFHTVKKSFTAILWDWRHLGFTEFQNLIEGCDSFVSSAPISVWRWRGDPFPSPSIPFLSFPFQTVVVRY